MNPLFIFGGLAIIGAMIAMQNQDYDGVDRGNVDDPMFQDTTPASPNYGGTGASEEAYWSGYGEGRHIQIPGRLG
tara:strand:+ start:422 stop:646 length:225 start_codon:yes stop_codon:yes gene_type:complete